MDVQNFIVYGILLVSLCTSDQSCGSNYREGDKWFNGCNWCVCHSGLKTCTHSTCSLLKEDNDVSPCQKLGESWRDGCYHCRCLPDGIRCTANKMCINTLKHVDLGCINSDTCVCGLDGVPSCSDEIMSRFAPQKPSHTISATSNDRKIILTSQDTPDLNLNADDTESDLNDDRLPLLKKGINQCHLGARWYSGGLRCYCDSDKGVACDNPRFIARKIDGFKIRARKCEVGKLWEEKCRICSCKKDEISFCRIDRECMKNKNIRHSSLMSKSAVSSKCKIGTRWKDGCKRCRCNKRGKVICKTRQCNESDNDKVANKGGKNPNTSTGVLLSSRPRFRMPVLDIRMRFNRKKRPHQKPLNCNGFKPGQKYWDKCNLCHCTSNGSPLCSSKLC